MKNGKKLKRRHKIFLSDKGLDPANWLIVKDTVEFMEFVNKKSGRVRRFNNE